MEKNTVLLIFLILMHIPFAIALLYCQYLRWDTRQCMKRIETAKANIKRIEEKLKQEEIMEEETICPELDCEGYLRYLSNGELKCDVCGCLFKDVSFLINKKLKQEEK